MRKLSLNALLFDGQKNRLSRIRSHFYGIIEMLSDYVIGHNNADPYKKYISMLYFILIYIKFVNIS